MFCSLTKQFALSMSTTAARAQKLKGKVAVVTASTEG
jgi:hypothetical protein